MSACKDQTVVGTKTRETVLSHCSQPSRKFQLGTCVLWGIAWAGPAATALSQRLFVGLLGMTQLTRKLPIALTRGGFDLVTSNGDPYALPML